MKHNSEIDDLVHRSLFHFNGFDPADFNPVPRREAKRFETAGLFYE